MPPQTRDFYVVHGDSVESLRHELNAVLQRLTDRLDKMEGLRGTSSPAVDDIAVGGGITVTDEDDAVIHSLE